MLGLLANLNPWMIAIALNTLLLGLAWLIPKKLLTPMGYLHAWVLAVVVWGSLGWAGYAVVMFYFLVGSLVTRIGKVEKEAAGIAEKRSGMRGPENVWGSAFAGVICALGVLVVNSEFAVLAIASPSTKIFLTQILTIGYVASFATKLADTMASEIGKAYGKTTYLITTLQPVPRGTEGAISLEGTLAGILGAIAIATLSWAIGLIDRFGIIWCVLAAFVATNIESLIGATWQTEYPWLTNEIVNAINTVIGAIAAILLMMIWLNVAN